ncbi:electron transfer flavoprotein beta subunit lysine methyltransferase-like isoform X2 [Ochlerotatus camptorhynchus]|uniref:electron transfer flavoprotein beta subunit lysine methyltransferase-like isoform X2 n=1 Tax=Ochlerotatus camptorhynchus TaxID=644619 RepID=UPI0031D48C7A
MLRRLAYYQQRILVNAATSTAMGVLPRRSSHHAARYHGDGGDEKNRSLDPRGSENIPAKTYSTPPASSSAANRVDPSDRSKILQNTKTSRQHLTPQLTLHLITEECTIYHRPIDDSFCFAAEPFWGFFWPGGQALTRFILDNGRLFSGKAVLDVGCGCGASSIAALLSGASFVTANDIDTVALQATLLNAELNIVEQLRLELDGTNLIGAPCDRYDVILIGDLFYDAEIADVLMPWLNKLAIAGKDIYIGDPGRHGLTETRMRNMIHLARFELPPNVCLENNGFSHANVWKFVADAGEFERMS